MKKLTYWYFVLFFFPFQVLAQNSVFLSAPVQWVNCGDVDLTGNQLTVEALIHMTDVSSNIISKHTDPSNVNYLLRPGGFEITTTSGYSSVPNGYLLSQNVTYHVAATYDGSTLKYYVNGCLTGQTAWSGNLVPNDLITAIGNQSSCLCEQFIGYIDEARIWSVARTQAEIQANMTTLPSPATQPGLLAYYDFSNSYLNAQGNTLYDGNPQGSSLMNIPLPLPAVLSSSSAATSLTCNASGNGTITITASGGLTPYSYSIDGINFQASNVFTNLAAGSYTAWVQSNASCLSSTNVIVSEPGPLSPATTGVTNANCYNSATGAASVTTTGGTLPYTYSWNTAPTQTTQTAVGLPAGSYTVTVTDVNGCTSSSSATITQPTPLTALISDTNNVSCNGGINGSATVTASGGYGTYSYTWNTTPVQNTATANNLAAGTYTVTVVDGSCSASGTELITNGTFSSGNSGFTSSYAYCNTMDCLFPEATYAVGSNPTFFHNGFAGTDHTTGSSEMMVVNGAAAANTTVWCQTVPVTPNTDYLFSTWVTSVTLGNPAMLQFSFNGVITGNILNAPSAVGAWDQFFSSWNSGANTSVDICIVNQNTQLGGNDFGLDDISFQQCAPSCSTIASVVITEPTVLTLDSAVTSVTCAGLTDGQATVIPSGGTTPYTFSWNTLPPSSASTITTGAGTYTAVVTDAAGCAEDIEVILTEPAPLNVVASQMASVSCFGLSDGSASSTATGGTGAYTYSWTTIPVQTTPAASSLSAGTYSVTITDANGCTATDTAIVGEPAPLIASVQLVSNVTCFGNLDGVLSASATGGSQVYFFTWSNGGNTQSISNAGAGLHYVLVMDTAGCYDTASVFVNEPDVLAISDSISNVSCFGLSDGQVILTVTGGTQAYTYSWSDGSVASTLTAAAGNYTVTVTDANGCTLSGSYTITEPAVLSVLTAAFDASCNGSCDGQVVAIIQGGTSPYSYSWTDPTISGAAGLDLCAGIYCVTATDDHGCTATVCDTVFEPSPIVITSGSYTAHCDKSDGTAFVSVSGGTIPYTFLWQDGQTTDTAFAIPGGDHIITISDQYNCTRADTITVGNAPGVVLSLQSVTDALCNDSCNGSASVFASGSSTPYLYSWNTMPVQSDDSASALCAGSYEVIVYDAFGCTDTVDVNIGEPAEVQTQVTDPTPICIGQSATITASASGGTAGYTYSWTPAGGLDVTVGPTVTATTSATTTYNVSVTDVNGCIASTEEVFVNVYPALAILASADDSLCLGQSVNISASASGGNGGPYNYSWTPATGLSGNTTSIVNASPVITTRYYVIASDGCTTIPAVDSVDVKVMSLPLVSFTPVVSQGCYPVTVDFMNTTPNALTSMWNLGDGSINGSYAPTHIYETPGLYDVTLVVTDYNRCTDSLKIIGAVEVYDHPVADFTFSPETVTILDPRYEFIDQSSGMISDWKWSMDTSLLSENASFIQTFSDTGSFSVNLFITDQHGCVDDTTYIVTVKDDHSFYLPNAFSPNGDGLNDKFGPNGIGISREDYLFQIFDRWGNLAFSTNDPAKAWDGKSGSTAIQDVYIWKIRVKNSITNTVSAYKGTVTIIK